MEIVNVDNNHHVAGKYMCVGFLSHRVNGTSNRLHAVWYTGFQIGYTPSFACGTTSMVKTQGIGTVDVETVAFVKDLMTKGLG